MTLSGRITGMTSGGDRFETQYSDLYVSVIPELPLVTPSEGTDDPTSPATDTLETADGDGSDDTSDTSDTGDTGLDDPSLGGLETEGDASTSNSGDGTL